MAEGTGPTPLSEFRRSEDFSSVYANNVQFQPTAWDLKLVLGELDQQGGRVTVEQHTCVTLPWLQVKLMNYYLGLNLAIHELQHGKIKVSNDLLPPVPPTPPEELAKLPLANTILEVISKMREEFIAGQ